MPAPIVQDIRNAHIETILEKVSQGVPLAQICRELGLGLRTFHDWRESNPELSARFARAREDGYDHIAEDCLAIADDPVPSLPNGGTDSGAVQHAKLRVETRLKLLAKWDPRRYGDKVQVGGAADLPAIQSTVTLDAADAYKALLEGKA